MISTGSRDRRKFLVQEYETLRRVLTDLARLIRSKNAGPFELST